MGLVMAECVSRNIPYHMADSPTAISSEMRLLSVRLFAFTPNLAPAGFNTSKVVSSVFASEKQLSARYDGEMNVSPGKVTDPTNRLIFETSPNVQLSSQNGVWKFLAFNEKSESAWFLPGVSLYGSDHGPEDISQIVESCLEVFEEFPLNHDLQIGRLAMIVRRFFPIQDAPNAIATHFCKEPLTDSGNPTAPFRNSKEMQINNLKRYEIARSGKEPFRVNSWVRVFSASISGKVDGKKGEDIQSVCVEQDINTLKELEVESNYSQEEIREFFDCAVQESQSIMRLYFENEV